MAACLATTVPREVWINIGLSLTAGDLLRLSQTCNNLLRKLKKIIQDFATQEQERMQIPYYGVPLSEERVVWEWRLLAPEQCREIRINLAGLPLIFYSERCNIVTRLLDEDVLDSRIDPERILPRLARKETEIRKAIVLVRCIANKQARSEALSRLALRKGIALETALEIAHMIPSVFWTTFTLRRLALIEGLPFDTALKIAMSVTDKKLVRAIIYEIADRIEDE